MGIITVTPVVAGTLATAAGMNTGIIDPILTQVNGLLDRTNIQTSWHRYCVTRRFYVATEAAGVLTEMQSSIIIPPTTDNTNAYGTYVTFTRKPTTSSRIIELQRFTLSNNGIIGPVSASITVADIATWGANDITNFAISPGTHGIRVIFRTITNPLEAEEWIDIDVWISTQIHQLTEA